MIGAMLPMLVAAAPMQQRADFAASAELVSFARDTGPATASAPGPDADRYLLIEHDAPAGQLVVTGIGVVAHGAPLPKPTPEVVGVIRTSKSAPSAADAVFADNANTLTVDPYALLNFKVGYDRGTGWSGYVEARNLFDTRYISTAVTAEIAAPASALFNPGVGRSIYGGLRYRM